MKYPVETSANKDYNADTIALGSKDQCKLNCNNEYAKKMMY